MIRSTTYATTRAVDRLIHSKSVCSCPQSQDLQRRIDTARPHIESAIERLVEIASSPESATGVVVGELRKALSAMESEDE
jgi:hypothetical protein